jgi:hypothetical protein
VGGAESESDQIGSKIC